MSVKTIFIGSSTEASVVPGWEDYEHKLAEIAFFSTGRVKGFENELAVTNPSGLNLSVNTGLALVEITNTNLAHGETYKVYARNDAAVSLTATDDTTNYVILKITPDDPNEASTNLATIECVTTVPANSLVLATAVAASGSITLTAGVHSELKQIKDAVTEYAGSSKAGHLIKLNDEGKISTSFVNVTESQYGAGADGAYGPSTSENLDFDNNNVLIKQFSSIDIPSGATIGVENVPDDGGLLVILCTGDLTLEGKIDGKGKGSRGGLAVTATSTPISVGSYSDLEDGAQPTKPWNVASTARLGNGGKAKVDIHGTNQSIGVGVSGASGSGSDLVAGSDTTAAENLANPPFSIAGVTGGTTVDNLEIMRRMLSSYKIAPGCGGPSGGAAVGAQAQNSTTLTGTTTATSGEGGRGGLSVMILCKGNVTITGEIDLSGGDAAAGSVSLGGQNGNSGNWAIGAVAGASAGGASGSLYIECAGTLTDGSATYTLNRGNSSLAVTDLNSAGHATAYSKTASSVAGNSAQETPYKLVV